MKNVPELIFICNTYMQLISAIQMKLTLFSSHKCDLILSDHSVNAEDVCERLKKTDLFTRTNYLHTKKNIYQINKLRDLQNVLEMAFSYKGKINHLLWDNMAYDRIFYFNHYDLIPLAIFEECLRNGSLPKICCYEEGILSYKEMLTFPNSNRRKLIFMIRKLLGKPDPFGNNMTYYCYYPELFPDHSKNVCMIPHLSRNDSALIKMLNLIFDYHPLNNDYPQKYFFFASSSDIDGSPIGETELVFQIAKKVGKKNLLIKMHPRDDRKVYEKESISVLQNSSIPWEVIQLNHDFSSHVFLTVSSGSVLNASAMLGDDIPTFYLYPLLQRPERAQQNIDIQHIEPTVKKMQSMGLLTNVRIARQMEDILNA